MHNSTKKTGFRWVIVALLFYSTTMVYFDRVILGILAPYISRQIGWSEQEYGYVVFAFQLSYAIGPLFIGFAISRLGLGLGQSANIFTVASDLFPKKIVGSVIGFSTTVCSVAGMITALLIGYALNESGKEEYVLPFVIAAFGYLAGLLVIHLISPGLKPVSINDK